MMNETNDTNNKSNGVTKIVMMAGVLCLAFLGGLYAYLGNTSNDVKTAANGTSAQCSVDDNLQARLNAAATGHVAAFKASDRAFNVSQFDFNNREGKAISMADWSGKTVLFNLWATWCAPCRAEMPALDALQKDIGGENFEVLPVSVDLGSAAKPKKFYEDIGLKNLGFFHDPDLKTLNTLKKNGLAFGLPATLLIDANGCVLGTLNGPAEWASDDAKQLIQAALQ